MSKQRIFMVIQNNAYVTEEQVICKKLIGLRNGIPWRELTKLGGYRLISYHSKGDYRDFKDHGIIEKTN